MSPASLTLAISTAGPVEVALLGGGRESVATRDKAALESLLALLTHALRQIDASLDDVALIGVCTGPGSFTGLRIGVAFAMSLAQARKLPIVGISAYDVAAFHIRSHPVIAVVRGKPGHYYARIVAQQDAEPRFIQGGRNVIDQAAADLGTGANRVEVAGLDFSAVGPGDAARRVALLARQAIERGAARHWTNIALDYGQRPNAVVDRKKRRNANEEGPTLARPET